MGEIENRATTYRPVEIEAHSPSITNIGIENKGTTSKTGIETEEDYIKQVGHTAYDVMLVVYHHFRKKEIISVGGIIAVLIFITAIITGHTTSLEEIILVVACIVSVYILFALLWLAHVIFIKLRHLFGQYNK